MSTPGKVGKSVFISHASANAALAERICRLMEKRGVTCWIAPRDVELGTRYGEAIIRAIESCQALFVLLSDESNQSDAVTNEVERAFSNKKRIIPLRLKDVKPMPALAFFLGQAQWVDVWGGGLEAKMDQLAATVKELDGAPAASVASPRAPAGSGGDAGIPPGRKRFALAWAAACLVIVAAAAAFYATARHRSISARAADFKTVAGTEQPVASHGVLVPHYKAIVIGINDYQTLSGDGWGKLGTARGDAEAVAKVLEDKYGFETKRLLDGGATRAAVLEALDELVACGPQDACVVYFAGHGFYDDALSEGYWIPADARRTADGRLTKEDWLWNSTITKIVSASLARHILVIADSCYGGSLFRGDAVSTPPAGDREWYGRALEKPSRYLIASGDMEPVPDSGGRHSVFAQELLNYLDHSDKTVFSASDLGLSLRQKVSAQTGQMVRMGPLAVSSHAGGEFVFVQRGAGDDLAAVAPAVGQPTRDAPAARTAGDKQQMLRDALALGRMGATNAAASLTAAVSGGSEDRLAQAVSIYMDREHREKSRAALAQLMDRIEARGGAGHAGAGEDGLPPRPRIVACIGPDAKAGVAEGEDLALLYRIGLRSELERLGGVQVVEREALEQVLQELNLGSSSLSDARARTEVGKLLPAGMLLLADLVPMGQGERLYARLVDTETSRVLASFTASRAPEQDMAEVCAGLAGDVRKKAIQLKPLTARAEPGAGNALSAGLGWFQGVADDTAFDVIERDPGASPLALAHDRVVGQAKVQALGEVSSEFLAAYTDASAAHTNLWLREKAP